MTNVKQVIVMRKKFPIEEKGQIVNRKLRTGKMVAQGAHASMAAVLSMVFKPTKFLWFIFLGKVLREWLGGRFTKVCASVETEEELLALLQQAKKAGLPCALITDAGLTEFNGQPTNTCIAIGPAYSEEIDPITGKLELL